MDKAINITPLLSRHIELMVIGISTGGPQTLGALWKLLPTTINVPIVIVQHMPANFENELLDNLKNKNPQINLHKATHRSMLQQNHIYIAPGGKQLKIYRDPADNKNLRFKLTDDPPVNDCLPSVDYFLNFAVEICQEKLALAIMTGMGDDGSVGAELVKKQGGLVIVQDPKDCVVNGMPMATINRLKEVDYIVSLKDLSEIISHLK